MGYDFQNPENLKANDKKLNQMLLVSIVGVVTLFILFIALHVIFNPFEYELHTGNVPTTQEYPIILNNGDEYSYLLESENGSQLINYSVKSTHLFTTVTEKTTNNTIDYYVNDYGDDPFSDDSVSTILFLPWMNSIELEWVQNYSTYSQVQDYIVVHSVNVYEVENVTKLMGRSAYVVNYYINDQLESVYWVDKEKRILLRQQTSFFNVTLINAPFNVGPLKG